MRNVPIIFATLSLSSIHLAVPTFAVLSQPLLTGAGRTLSASKSASSCARPVRSGVRIVDPWISLPSGATTGMLTAPACVPLEFSTGPQDKSSPLPQAAPQVPLQPQPRTLQSVFDLARLTFGQDRAASTGQLELLRRALGRVKLEEMGLTSSIADLPCAQARAASPGGVPPIQYLHIYEDADLSLGIFCIPAGARIPLHNHPGMTVLSRVLVGELHVLSFDWAPPPAVAGPAGRPVVKVLDAVLRAGGLPTMLLPESQGNMHQFTAVTDCAVLDLLTPPYSIDEGRDCTYYAATRDLRPEGLFYLQETEPPLDFVVVDGQYLGRYPSARLTTKQLDLLSYASSAASTQRAPRARV